MFFHSFFSSSSSLIAFLIFFIHYLFCSFTVRIANSKKKGNVPIFHFPSPLQCLNAVTIKIKKKREKNIIERIYDSLLKMVLKNFEIKKILFYSKCTGIKKYRDQRVNNVKLHQSRPIEFHFRDGNSFSSNSSNCLRSS